MSGKKPLQQIFGLTLVVLLLIGCTGTPSGPTAMPTPVPPSGPTITPTPVPPVGPTVTPTPVPPGVVSVDIRYEEVDNTDPITDTLISVVETSSGCEYRLEYNPADRIDWPIGEVAGDQGDPQRHSSSTCTPIGFTETATGSFREFEEQTVYYWVKEARDYAEAYLWVTPPGWPDGPIEFKNSILYPDVLTDGAYNTACFNFGDTGEGCMRAWATEGGSKLHIRAGNASADLIIHEYGHYAAGHIFGLTSITTDGFDITNCEHRSFQEAIAEMFESLFFHYARYAHYLANPVYPDTHLYVTDCLPDDHDTALPLREAFHNTLYDSVWVTATLTTADANQAMVSAFTTALEKDSKLDMYELAMEILDYLDQTQPKVVSTRAREIFLAHGFGRFGAGAEVGVGTTYGAGTYFRPGSQVGEDGRIGDDNIFGPGSQVGNNVSAGDNNTYEAGSQIADEADIGNDNTFDTGSQIGNEADIGNDNTFGAESQIGDEADIGSDNTFGFESQIGNNVTIGDDVTIEEDAQVGNGVTIGDDVTIEQGAQVGNGVTIGDDVTIEQGAKVGDNVTISAGVTIDTGQTVPPNIAVCCSCTGDFHNCADFGMWPDANCCYQGCLAITGSDVHDLDGNDNGVPCDNNENISSGADIGNNVTWGNNVTIETRVQIGNNVTIGDDVTIEEGAQVGNGVTIGDDATIEEDTQVGDGVTIGDNVTIEEGAQIGNNVDIYDGATIKAGAQVGNDVLIGKNVTVHNAVIQNNVTIGDGATVRAGANVGDSANIHAGVTIGAGQAVPPNTTVCCSCTGNLYDCDDFDMWPDAYCCYLGCKAITGSDVHNMDGNNNGMPCE